MIGSQLIASHYTLAGSPPLQPARFGFEERVAAAAAAGFDGIGLLSDEYEAARASGLTDADLRAILASHDMRVAEIEFLYDWAYDDERAGPAAEIEARLWAMAEVFEPHHLNVGDIQMAEDLPPLERVAERFAVVCNRAADRGLLVGIEFLPWSGIPDAATAWEVARLSGCSNGGVLVDTWHHFRGACDDGMLRAVPPDRIVAIQFDDAGPAEGPMMEDTMLRRRLPGEGEFDLVGFVRLLDDHGVQAPISVEILSLAEHALPVVEAARRAADSTRAVLAAARQHSVTSQEER
jgi:sugar phosphate isomerase/epimerase